MKIIKLEHLTSIQLGKITDAHGTVVYPTDTIYGIGCNALDNEAVKKVYEIKGRDYSRQCSVICPSLAAIDSLVILDGRAKEIVSRLLPGPYTFVAKAREIIPFQKDTIAFRIPEGRFTEIVSELGAYFITTSANLSGQPPAVSFKEVNMGILQKVDLSVDGGACKYAAPSTIIDLEKMCVLRKGASKPEHEEILGRFER